MNSMDTEGDLTKTPNFKLTNNWFQKNPHAWFTFTKPQTCKNGVSFQCSYFVWQFIDKKYIGHILNCDDLNTFQAREIFF